MKMIKQKSRLLVKPGWKFTRTDPFTYLQVRIALLLIIISCLSNPLTSAQTSYDKTTTKGVTDPGFTKLYDFEISKDGDWIPNIVLISPWIYTLHEEGGTMGFGSILKTKTDGSDILRWWMWDSSPNDLESSGGMLYGTKRSGGENDNGLIYKTNYDGTGWKTIFNFPWQFSWPRYDLTVKDTIIYGVANEALGSKYYIFSIKTDGSGFSKLPDLSGLYPIIYVIHENYIFGTVIVDSDYRIFRMKTDGTDFTLFDCFSEAEFGAGPYSLILVDDYIYGLTGYDYFEEYVVPTLWRIKTDGTDFTTLHEFEGQTESHQVVLGESFIYGISPEEGDYGLGRIFRINKDGTGYQKVYDFQDPEKGYYPSNFVMSGDTIFGLTYYGGADDAGVLYRYNIGNTPAPDRDTIRVKKLSIKSPVEMVLDTKGTIIVEKGSYLNLDTTFTATGNVGYTHNWKVKSGGGYEIVNNIMQANSDRTYYIFLTTIENCYYVDSIMIQVKQATEIGETVSENSFNAYPNPNNGFFYVRLPDPCEDYSYEIFNMSGTKINSGSIYCAVGDCTYAIMLNNKIPGAYLLVIKKGNMILGKQKFVISR